jgi:hypothetical protein
MNHHAILLLLALAGLTGCAESGPTLHSVRGAVRINGQPAERVVVSFRHTDPAVTGNAAHPCTVTDASGAFSISTNRDGDGAVPGEYLVSFTWQSNPDPDLARDLLAGSYEGPQAPQFRVKVSPEGPTDLTPFDLAVDPARAKEFVK